MKRFQKFVSLVLILLLLISVTAPAVSAEAFEPVMFIVVNPVTVKLAFDGITTLVTNLICFTHISSCLS